MIATTLLVGGPKDGEVLAVNRWHEAIKVAEITEDVRALYARAFDPVEPVPTRTTVYLPERLSFFGVPLLVHVHESLQRDDLPHALARHLLSDKGKAVALP